MEHKVVAIAVLTSGKVYHNTITVKCADRNKALTKARRMLELWKGADNIRESFGFFVDDKDNYEDNLRRAKAILFAYGDIIKAHAAGY